MTGNEERANECDFAQSNCLELCECLPGLNEQPLLAGIHRKPVSANSNFEDQRAGTRYAAPKPTVDEILASVARHNKTSADFLKADIEMALTFAGIARTPPTIPKRENETAALPARPTTQLSG